MSKSKSSVALAKKYPYLVAWCKYMGSYSYYIKAQLHEAETDNAPLTAISKKDDGTWLTFEEIKNSDTKAYIADLVKSITETFK